MKSIELIRLIISILICNSAGFIGSIFTSSTIPTWYNSLEKPSFNPPNWIFGPVWTTLYTLMGISAYLVWSQGLHGSQVKTALIIFAAQLFLNAIWSPIFFGLRALFAAFLVIVVLWIAILLTILIFYKISTIAAVLLIPYILWVSFATILNYSLWILNS
ncbi:MAG: tryptophan-rich sensory protein [Candidatus Bathyarchaeota archaeon]|nr:tryptophan-rich sensory protein [Candidatus Bathyarchaeota archaeon]